MCGRAPSTRSNLRSATSAAAVPELGSSVATALEVSTPGPLGCRWRAQWGETIGRGSDWGGKASLAGAAWCSTAVSTEKSERRFGHETPKRVVSFRILSQTLHICLAPSLKSPGTTPTDRHIWQSHGVSGLGFLSEMMDDRRENRRKRRGAPWTAGQHRSHQSTELPNGCFRLGRAFRRGRAQLGRNAALL